jgi:hypothetical protein
MDAMEPRDGSSRSRDACNSGGNSNSTTAAGITATAGMLAKIGKSTIAGMLISAWTPAPAGTTLATFQNYTFLLSCWITATV